MGGLWHVFTHISQIMLLYMAWSIIFMAIVIILKCTKWRYSGDTSDFRYDDYWWISQYLCVMPVVGVYWGIPNFLSPTCFFYIMALGLSHKIENYLNAWAFLCVFFLTLKVAQHLTVPVTSHQDRTRSPSESSSDLRHWSWLNPP